MLDAGLLRSDPGRLKTALAARTIQYDLDELLVLDQRRRQLIAEHEQLNQLKNRTNGEISRRLKEKKDVRSLIDSMKATSQKIDEIRPKVEGIEKKFEEKWLLFPNLPSTDTPPGKDSASNKIVKESNTKNTFVFKPKNHVELGESLGILDLKRSASIAGSSFVLFTGLGASLERAMINFMLDIHVREHGYREVSPPFLVKRKCMVGTGQLPKFEGDMYRIFGADDLFLVPTAEVPLTNLHREEVLSEEDLPIRYVAYTPCFRQEAGAYGQETKGMVRVHQFDKVELVKFTKPEDSTAEHEKLLRDAARIMDLLGIPYRVVLLCTGDLGFAAAKCYDIEVWAPGLGRWLEASSCSNFEDFQARRAGIKFREKASKKTRYVHTLNGSGVALARTFIAVLENCQQADGSVLIPEVLRPYMGGQTHIRRKS